jgi:hypothetical protein
MVKHAKKRGTLENPYRKLYYSVMVDLFFSTGQAARELHATQDRIRALCQTEAIACELTAGGQFRIPRTEVERLKLEGLPIVPRPLPNGEDVTAARRPGGQRTRAALLAEPSEEVIDSAEAVVRLENEVKSVGLRRQMEEQLDWFRDREDRQAQRQAQQDEVDRRRQARINAEQRRAEWLRSWEDYAIELIVERWNAPPEVQLAVQEAIREKLSGFRPLPTDDVTEAIVNAIVNEHAGKLEWDRDVHNILIEASNDWLPIQARGTETEPSEWQRRARRAAGDAMNKKGESYEDWKDLPISELRDVARRAVSPIIVEFEHVQNCERILQGVFWKVWGATTEESEGARNKVSKALDAIPVGTSYKEMERVRDAALQPFKAAIAKRNAEEEKRKKEERRTQEIESTVSYRLGHVYDYLGQLEQEGELEFTWFFDRSQMAQRLEERIRPILVNEMRKKQATSDEYIERRIEQLVDQNIDELCEE